MRAEARSLIVLGTIFGLMSALYWFWGHEDAGGVMIFAAMLLCFVPGFYYRWWSRRMRPRPEDDPDATPAHGAGVVGTFPGTSIWPFTLGMGAFFVAISLVFGIWFLVPGIGLAAWALFGGTAEGRRGGTR